MSLVTTALEVAKLFVAAPDARHKFNGWSTNPRRRHVVKHVMAHRTETVYRLSPADMEVLLHQEGHALGNTVGTQAREIESIDRWNPAFAFTHVFHYILESKGAFPTWDDARAFLQSDETARSMLWDPALEKIQEVCREGWSRERVEAAVTWRVGNFYYSFLREIYTVVLLRAAGLDVRVHPLADALFRADAWCGRTVVTIYVRNPQYRDGRVGRKQPAESILAGADPPFSFHAIALPPASEFGEAHLPDDNEIQKAITAMR
ncbi:hypothetical protein [Streptosporangium sp. NPDC049078]|uniref:hypothetical protein n=1 Tax=Streptosporangium sp. NPDC049078 TaxID=3155767 RepID=UPI00344130D6